MSMEKEAIVNGIERYLKSMKFKYSTNGDNKASNIELQRAVYLTVNDETIAFKKASVYEQVSSFQSGTATKTIPNSFISRIGGSFLESEDVSKNILTLKCTYENCNFRISEKHKFSEKMYSKELLDKWVEHVIEKHNVQKPDWSFDEDGSI